MEVEHTRERGAAQSDEVTELTHALARTREHRQTPRCVRACANAQPFSALPPWALQPVALVLADTNQCWRETIALFLRLFLNR